jgi:dihydrofolate reductase
MRKIGLFMNVSLDGYVEMPGHDISGFIGENQAFSAEQSQNVDTVLLGHRTYEMMKSFWPTPQAAAAAPEIAKFMREKRKVVASHQPFEPGWSNATVISGEAAGTVKQLKQQPGQDIIILGSNRLCTSLLQAGLIDELQIMLNPVVFGAGTSLLQGLPGKAELRLADTRKFESGAILLTYAPVKAM